MMMMRKRSAALNAHCFIGLQQIHASEKDLNAAGGLLAVGADYSQISNANYTKVLFLLSRCMLLLIDKKFAEVSPLLNSTGHQVENWQGNPHQKEYLKVYFLVLQVCHYLMSGQVRTVLLICFCASYIYILYYKTVYTL